MKQKTLIVMACLLIVGFLQAQEEIRLVKTNDKIIGDTMTTEVIYMPKETLQYPISIQLVARNKARMAFMTAYLKDLVGNVGNLVNLSATSEINFNVEYHSFFKSKVRLHWTWIGPEFVTASTDWFNIYANQYYTTFIRTSNAWKKGTYKLVVGIEIKNLSSGATVLVECNYMLQ